MLTYSRYLTDITSSEGQLKHMSTICSRIADMRVLPKRKTARIFKDIGIKHPKVIGRYLHILKFIGLIADKGEFYSLRSEGKVLSQVSEDHKLSTEERILFFKLFFEKIPDQLYWVLYAIKRNEKCESSRMAFEYACIEYFSIPQIQSIWNKRTLEKSIREYRESGKLARGIENKFETMCAWLRQMKMVERLPLLHLTSKGRRILRELDGTEEWKQLEIDRITAKYHTANFVETILQGEMNLISGLVEGSLKRFSNEAGLSDLRAVCLHLFLLSLSKHRLLLSRKDFHSIIETLKEKGKIKSFILDRKGKLSIVQI